MTRNKKHKRNSALKRKPAKEPWEMTFSKYRDANLRREDYAPGISAGLAMMDLARQHRESVEEAVDEGKPVPRKVLEDYKDEKWAQEVETGAML